MTDERKEKLGFSPDGWDAFVNGIAEEYGDGKIIPHEWLREQFGFKPLRLEDFDSLEDFLKARDIQSMAYGDAIQHLKWELVKSRKMLLRNVRGDGYEIIRPEDQVQYGYDEFIKDVKKAIWECNMIMNNVLAVDLSQQAKDNDLRAKFGLMKQMLGTIKSEL